MKSCSGPLVTVAVVGVTLMSEAVNAPSPEVANSSEKSNFTTNAALTGVVNPSSRETTTVGTEVSGDTVTAVVTDSASPVVETMFPA